MIQRRYYKTIRVIVDSDGGGTPFYIENVDTVPGYFTLKKQGNPTYTPNLNYRIDNGEWFEYDMTNLPLIEVPTGSKIYLKGNNTNGFNQTNTTSNYYTFKFYSSKTTTSNFCKFNIGGYITSLLALENFNLINHIPDNSFISLFSINNSLLSAENLITSNITNVGSYGFCSCFQSCTLLVTAPTFENVTSVGGYGFDNCFIRCTSLVTAPTFENVTSVGGHGFSSCFNDCSALVTAPKFENVTSVGGHGFERCFNGCSALVTAPTFENVTSVEFSGFMCCFSGCTSLVTGPSFKNITSIKSSFYECFNNCISLETIIAPRPSTWDISKFVRWVQNVPSTGTFYKKKGLEIPIDTSGIPEGWTVVEED